MNYGAKKCLQASKNEPRYELGEPKNDYKQVKTSQVWI